MQSIRILIGSPIRQRPEILKEYLESLNELDKNNFEVYYYFINDNTINESSILLYNFGLALKNIEISEGINQDEYLKDESNKHWTTNLVWKVADYKNRIIKKAIDEEFDYLFLVDSDLLLHPNTLKVLISTKKDIISEIVWTSWLNDIPMLPNIWLYDNYDLIPKEREESSSEKDLISRLNCFIEMLKTPGIYEVGGLSACTLISREALLKGVNFKEIKNISFLGEDRHFCIRAAVLGIPLFVDTSHPAYHIYRDSDLQGVKEYKDRNSKKYK